MATESKSAVPQSSRLSASGYERRDVHVPWLFGIVIFMICSGLLIQWLLGEFLGTLNRSPSIQDAWRPIQRPTNLVVAFPRLQISPRNELGQFRVQEDAQLTNYGWVNRTAGVVRVPIERAIELVLQKGLPVRTNSTQVNGPSPAQLQEQRVSNRQPGIPQDR